MSPTSHRALESPSQLMIMHAYECISMYIHIVFLHIYLDMHTYTYIHTHTYTHICASYQQEVAGKLVVTDIHDLQGAQIPQRVHGPL